MKNIDGTLNDVSLVEPNIYSLRKSMSDSIARKLLETYFSDLVSATSLTLAASVQKKKQTP